MSELNEPSAIAGAVVLSEAANLIRGLRVAPGRAAMAEGEEVTILIAPCWREDKTFALSFTCRARGLQKVDWSQLFLWARSTTEQKLDRIELNQRGQSWLAPCRPMEYVLWARFSGEEASLKGQAPSVPATTGKCTPARAAGQAAEPITPAFRVYRTKDDRVTATLTAYATHLEIVCETLAANLAGATVQIYRRTVDAREPQPIAEVTLQAAEEQVWRGTWRGPNLPGEELEFFVIPPPAFSGEQP